MVQAVGETWEKFPELKFLALKRMYKYMVRFLTLLFVVSLSWPITPRQAAEC